MSRNEVSIKPLRFGLVRAVLLGFDAMNFWLLLYVIPSSTAAIDVSVTASIFLSWLINRSFTFSYNKIRSTQEFIKLVLSQLAGALVNAPLPVLAFSFLPPSKKQPVDVRSLGQLRCLMLNFTIAHLYVFKNKNNNSHIS